MVQASHKNITVVRRGHQCLPQGNILFIGQIDVVLSATLSENWIIGGDTSIFLFRGEKEKNTEKKQGKKEDCHLAPFIISLKMQ